MSYLNEEIVGTRDFPPSGQRLIFLYESYLPNLGKDTKGCLPDLFFLGV